MIFLQYLRTFAFNTLLILGIFPTTIFANEALSPFIEKLLNNNPEIQAAKATIETNQARFIGAGLPLNNPELGLETIHTDIDTYTISINQTVDIYDKRQAFEQVARAELLSAKMALQSLRLHKTKDLLLSIDHINTFTQVTTLAKQRVTLLKRFVKLAEKRFHSGDIAQAELELARLSLIESVMQSSLHEADLINAKGQFRKLSGYTLKKRIKFPDSSFPPSLPKNIDVETFTLNHPDFLLAQQKNIAIRQEVLLVDKQRKADPTFGLTAGKEGNNDLIGVSLSIPLLVRNNAQSRVTAIKSEAIKTEHEAFLAKQNLTARIFSAKENYQLLNNTWAHWKSQGINSLIQRSHLLEKQWKAGEMNTTDYLIQLQQTLDTQISGAQLQGSRQDAWIEWLSSTNTLNHWLANTSMETES